MVKIMRCPKCKKECSGLNSIASNTYICPFCGNNFSHDGNNREDIKQIIKKIVEILLLHEKYEIIILCVIYSILPPPIFTSFYILWFALI